MAQKRNIIDTINLVSSSDNEQDLPQPKKKSKVVASAVASGSSKENVPVKSKQTAPKKAAQKEDTRPLLQRIAEVELNDDIRRKILKFTVNSNYGVTKKAFCEAIGNVNSNSLRVFQSYKGATKGAGSCVYGASYIFFEKLRILEGKPKSAARKRTEDIIPDGYSTEIRRNQTYVVPKGVNVYEDNYGRVYTSRG